MKFNHPTLLRARTITLTVVILLCIGILMRPLEAPAWDRVQSGQPELNLAEIDESLGQGLVIGMFGGFRSVMANFLWIRINTIWEQRDIANLDPMLRLVTTLDPRSDFFWINASRMIAYDVPHWRIRDEGGHAEVPEWRQQEINHEQAEYAFEFVNRAIEFHPDNPRLYLEMGQIYLNRLKDPAQAAPWFKKAAEKPGAPRFAARIYAELLRRQGLNLEAYNYLKELHEKLPDDDPYSQKHVILERIRELEQTLQIPIWNRYQP